VEREDNGRAGREDVDEARVVDAVRVHVGRAAVSADT